MLNYRVSLSFTGLSDSDLDEFASNIVVSLTGNTAFPTPLVPLAALNAAQSAFHDAVLAAAQGGTHVSARFLSCWPILPLGRGHHCAGWGRGARGGPGT